MSQQHVLGIDIGGTGIKGALVDLAAGDFVGERYRIETPAESTPVNVAKVVAQIVDHFGADVGDGPVGITFPAIVQHGTTLSAANVDSSWINAPAQQILSEHLGRPVVLVNDADAAGLAEVKYGAAKDADGLVIITTLGTGIGSAMVYNGVLIRTPSWVTWRSMATTPRSGPRPASRPRRASATTSTCRGCSATTRWWSSCSPPT